MEQAALAAVAGSPVQFAAAGARSPEYAAWITSVSAFPGCFQVLLQLSVPKEQNGGDMQQLVQQLQHAADQLVVDWPDLQGVLDVQLQHQREQEQLAAWTPLLTADFAADAAGPLSRAAWPALAARQAVKQADAVRLQVAMVAAADASSSMAGAACNSLAMPQSASVNGVYVQPVAGALPGLLHTYGLSNAAPEVLTTELVIPKAVVVQLLTAGQSSVRVVVASQLPAGELLMDTTWQLLKTEANGALCTATGAAAGIKTAVDLQLQLQIPLRGSPGEQQQQQVLTVVILAGHVDSGDCHSEAAPASRIDTHAVDQGSHAGLAAVGPYGQPVVSPMHGVIAQFPLMVLPARAASELQSLFESILTAGTPHSVAYAQLLPLLQDMAAALCVGQGSLLTETVSQGGVPPPLLESLSAAFTQHSLQHCQQLLDASCSPASSISTGISLTASSNSSSGNNDSNSNKNAPQWSDTCKQPACTTGPPASACSTPGLPGFEAASLPVPANSVQFNWKSVVFGFPSAAAEGAYHEYKAAAFHLVDFVIMFTCGVGALVPCVQLLLLLCSAAVTGSAPADVLGRSTVFAMRGLYVGVHFATHALVWAAGTGGVQLRGLRQWRSAVLFAGIGINMCITAVCLMVGGVAGNAALQVVQEFMYVRWVLPLHRDLLYPVAICAEVVPYTVCFLAMHFLAIDPRFRRAEVLGLGPTGSAVLLVLVHQTVAVVLEASMRKRFVRHIQGEPA